MFMHIWDNLEHDGSLLRLAIAAIMLKLTAWSWEFAELNMIKKIVHKFDIIQILKQFKITTNFQLSRNNSR